MSCNDQMCHFGDVLNWQSIEILALHGIKNHGFLNDYKMLRNVFSFNWTNKVKTSIEPRFISAASRRRSVLTSVLLKMSSSFPRGQRYKLKLLEVINQTG